jgi:flagellar biosynthetic protein FliS
MKPIDAYIKSRTETAPPQDVLVMLFQEAVYRLTRALHTVDTPNSAWRADLHHARSIYAELLAALDHAQAPELCADLHRLYVWAIEELTEATRDAQPARIRTVLKVSATLLDGWRQAQRASSGST